MNQPAPLPPKERNPITHARHRKEVLWQIALPVAIGVVICLALAFLTTQMTNDQASTWADISVIWLIIPALAASMILAILMTGAIYAVTKLIQVLPFFFYQAHRWLLAFGVQVNRIGNKAVEPVLRAHSFSASVRKLGGQVKRK